MVIPYILCRESEKAVLSPLRAVLFPLKAVDRFERLRMFRLARALVIIDAVVYHEFQFSLPPTMRAFFILSVR